MKRTARDKNDTVRPKPVQKIALDEKPSRAHVLIFIGFVVLAAVSLFFGIRGCVTKEPGWDTVAPGAYADSCANDFVFQYNFGQGETSATDESRALSSLYNSLARRAYRLFHESESFEDVHNIAYIAAHPGEEVTVDPALYKALSAVTENGNRYIYYAPIFCLYENFFNCEDGDDLFAEEFDPTRQAALREQIGQLLTFVGDPEAIRLAFLPDNRVTLTVSNAYRAYLAEHEDLPTLSFFRMKNALVIDYLADACLAAGFTNGVISCADGFIRNLNPSSEDTLIFGIQDADEHGVRVAATFDGAAFGASVQLRDFSRGASDPYAYTYRNGDTVTAFISLADGMPTVSARLLSAASKTKSCTELFVRLYSLYTGAYVTDTELLSLVDEDIHTVCAFGADRVLYVSDNAIQLENLYTGEEIIYTSALLPF